MGHRPIYGQPHRRVRIRWPLFASSWPARLLPAACRRLHRREGGIRAFFRARRYRRLLRLYAPLRRAPALKRAPRTRFSRPSRPLLVVCSVSYPRWPRCRTRRHPASRQRSPLCAIRTSMSVPAMGGQKLRWPTKVASSPPSPNRYRISSVSPMRDAVAAVLARDGLSPLVEIASAGCALPGHAALCRSDPRMPVSACCSVLPAGRPL
jgi:hypothetical protein